ncbi:MAG TPA: gliding motility-associated C-terminal domain-containing protein [Bacteroidales bacterium]|nr:gliding motility-associated C-terminal domain-containing protein [Bacteroidales bacterium]
MKKVLILIFLLIAVSQDFIRAQSVQDCLGAIPICESTYWQLNSYVGFSNQELPNQGANNTNFCPGHCFSTGEHNTVWYTFTAQSSGNLSFLITPVVTSDDYDWAVYNITTSSCSDIYANPWMQVSCNFCYLSGNTGPNGASGSTCEGPNNCSQFNADIPVTAGQIYALLIDNFTGYGAGHGYNIDFTPSTASIFDNTPPALASISGTPACGSNQLIVNFSENILCSTIANCDFQLTGPGGPYTIAGVSGTDCSGGVQENTYTFSVSPAMNYGGTYTLSLMPNSCNSVSDQCGNIATASSLDFYITGPAVTLTATPNPICAGVSSTLTASGAMTYIWSGGLGSGTTKVVTPLTTATYTVSGTSSSGCVGTSSVTVTVNAMPTVTASATSPLLCNGQCTSLTGGGATSYAWMPGNLSGTTVSVCPTVSTVYTVTGSLGAGCSNTTTTSVTVNNNPVVTASASPPAICAGQCTNISASGASVYTWMPGNLSGSTVSVCPTSTTTYTVSATSANGCSGTASVTVTVNSLPAVTSAVSPPVICSGQCTNISAAGASTYSWMPGNLSGSNVSVCPVSATTYTVTGTDGNGCSNTAAVSVTVNTSPTISIPASPPAICSGQCANLSATGATSYTWMPGNLSGATVSVCPTSSTIYTVTGSNGLCTNTASVPLTVNPLPTANAGSDHTQGGCNTTVLNGTGTGTGVLSYSWLPAAGLNNPNIPNPIAGPATTTNYTLTVTDVNGCSANDNVLITVSPLSTANAGADQTLGACLSAANANLNGTGTGSAPLTFSWLPANGLSNTGIANPVADPVSTVTYTLTVTDAYGCTATDAVVITVAPLPSADAGTNQNIGACLNAANASINAISTGTPPLIYSWSPAAGLNNPNILNPVADPVTTAVYTLTVTDTYGCQATDAITITVDPLPSANAGYDQNIGSCANAPGANLNGTATGTSPLTYLWSPATGLSNPSLANPVANPAATAVYAFTMTDAYGCTAFDEITINVDPLPTADAGPDQYIGNCLTALNATITASGTGTGPLTYSWLPAGGLSATNIPNPVANPAATTTYSLSVSDSYGCSATDEITIFVDPLPTVNTGNDLSIGSCSNAAGAVISSIITGIAPLSYSWLPISGLSNPSIPDPVAHPNITTAYTLTVTDIFGCTASDDIVITVAALPSVNAGADQHSGGCPNAPTAIISTTATGIPPFSYNWSPATGLSNPGISNPVADPQTSTNYIVTLADAFGCSATDDILIIIDPIPASDAGSDQNTGACPNAPPATLNGTGTGATSLSYLWTPQSNVVHPDSAVTDAHPFSTTVYTLIVTDNYGCTDADEATITVAPAPAAHAGNDTSIGSCSWSMADLQGSATGAFPFGYNWIPATGVTNSYIPNPQAHPPVTTVYTLLVTDIYGCTAQDFVTVTVSPTPTVAVAANPDSVCASFSSTLNAFGTLYYSWSPGTGLSSVSGPVVTATPPSTTTYTVTASDQYTCTADAQITVFVKPNPVITVAPSSPALCSGDSITLSANGAETYSWMPVSGLSPASGTVVTASPNTTITYTVTGTTHGCSGSDSVTVTVHPLPSITFTPLNNICLNDAPFTLTQASPAGGYYAGPGITGTDSFNPSVAGTGTHIITYTYTDNYNCTNSATQILTVKPNPVLTITPDHASVCLGTSVLLQAAGADTYAWSPVNTLSDSTGSSVSATPTTSTTYTVTGTTDGCSSSESVTVNTYTTIPVAVTPPSDSLCPGQSTLITASGAFNYQWLPTEGLSSYTGATVVCTPTVTTIYTVLGDDNNGCTGTATVTVILYPEAFLHFNIEPVSGCLPLYVEFTYLPDGTLDMNTLQWDFGDLMSSSDISDQPVSSYTYTYPGNFFVMITGMSEHGCHAVGFDTVFVYKKPEADFYTNPEAGETNNPIINFYDQSNYATHWQWNFGDPETTVDNTSELQYPVHIYSDSGNFIVMLIASNTHNCSDTAIKTIKIRESFVFWVPNAFTPNNNGVNDGFIGKGVGFNEDDFEMFIFDRWGKQVFYTQDCYKSWDGYNANGSKPCEEGVYVWLINITEKTGIRHKLKGTVTIYR